MLKAAIIEVYCYIYKILYSLNFTELSSGTAHDFYQLMNSIVVLVFN